MGASHTPGPWEVEGTRALGAYGVWTRDADPRNPGHDGAGYQVMICSMNPMDTTTPIGKEEREANARLIAAAPDLLAACKAQAALIARHALLIGVAPGTGARTTRVTAVTRAAIAKAEGGAA